MGPPLSRVSVILVVSRPKAERKCDDAFGLRPSALGRADREHVLCFQCFRSERERQRARQMALFPPAPAARYQMTTPSAGLCYAAPARSKNAHRRRMLEHLEAQAKSLFAEKS